MLYMVELKDKKESPISTQSDVSYLKKYEICPVHSPGSIPPELSEHSDDNSSTGDVNTR